MKDKRHMRIKEIVSQREVETQEELIRLLNDAGFSATQATISRDIKELQLIKVIGSQGRYKYAIPVSITTASIDGLRRKLTDVFVSLARAGNLLVLKVMPGNAQSIGFILDSIRIQGLLGTLAGDDTILLVCADDTAALELEQALTL